MALESYLERAIAAVVLGITVYGCATPPGQFKDSDFVSRTVALDIPASHALSNFYEGMRTCGDISGVTLGLAECGPVRPDGSATCDVYLKGLVGRSDWVYGRLDFAPSATGSSAIFRAQSKFPGPERSIAVWESLVKGRARSICPAS